MILSALREVWAAAESYGTTHRQRDTFSICKAACECIARKADMLDQIHSGGTLHPPSVKA
jgi:hypothetical protein